MSEEIQDPLVRLIHSEIVRQSKRNMYHGDEERGISSVPGGPWVGYFTEENQPYLNIDGDVNLQELADVVRKFIGGAA